VILDASRAPDHVETEAWRALETRLAAHPSGGRP